MSKSLTGAACGPFMRSTCRDWRGPRLAASLQVIPSSVAARKLEAASAHRALADPFAAQASRASSTSRGVSIFSCPCMQFDLSPFFHVQTAIPHFRLAIGKLALGFSKLISRLTQRFKTLACTCKRAEAGFFTACPKGSKLLRICREAHPFGQVAEDGGGDSFPHRLASFLADRWAAVLHDSSRRLSQDQIYRRRRQLSG